MNNTFFRFIIPVIYFFFLPSISQNQVFSIENYQKENKLIFVKIEAPKDNYILFDSIHISQNLHPLVFKMQQTESGTIVSEKIQYNVIYNNTKAELKINLDNFIDPIIIKYNLLNITTKQIENFQEELLVKKAINDTAENKINSQKAWYSYNITHFLMNMLTKQNNIIVLFFIFLLGILMSLTPCIYPMIPITISILGIDKKKAKERLLAGILYALGIALTFSILGLLAATGKIIFGNLLANHVFITIITIILFFMTINMMGIIQSFFNINTQIKIPDCIQNSKILPFLYGIFSGTITSPCVSPGLFGLLTLVSQQNNIFIGWLWLFIFGLGLASPLVLISLLTNTAWKLPGSGTWMNTLKEFLGIILLFILHKNISMISNFFIATIIILFIFLIFLIKKIYITKTLSFSTIIAVILFGTLLTIITQQNIIKKNSELNFINEYWQTNFEQAMNTAKNHDKLLLVDFSADWCTICKNVEKELLYKKSFIEGIKKICILCKVDCTKPDQKTKYLLKKYNIQGLPSIFLINPQKETILEQYHGDILSIKEKKLINKIESLQIKEYSNEK